MIGLLFLPDTPRWLLMHGRKTEAQDVTARLLGLPQDHEDVKEEMESIEAALRVQKRSGGFKFRELLTGGPSQNLRRTFLGVAAQFFQQMTGKLSGCI